MELKYFKLYDDVRDLTFGTEESACFDLRVYLKPGLIVQSWNEENFERKRSILENRYFIDPGERVLLPTGIIFDIPRGYSVRIHPRSSVAIKRGLVNRNAEGIIDSDYFHESKISLVNTTKLWQQIMDGDRLLQCELVPVLNYELNKTTIRPTQRTNRIGGFGSTGV